MAARNPGRDDEIAIRELVVASDICHNLDGLAYCNYLKMSATPFKVQEHLPMDVRIGSKYYTYNHALQIKLEEAESSHPLANGRKISKIIARLDSLYLALIENDEGRQYQNLLSDVHKFLNELQAVINENVRPGSNILDTQIYNAIIAKKVRESEDLGSSGVDLTELFRTSNTHNGLLEFMVYYDTQVKELPLPPGSAESSDDEN